LKLGIAFCGFSLLGVSLLSLPTGRVFDRAVTAHFVALNQRREQRRLSWWDGVQCQILFNGIATIGGIASPEAGRIVGHYIHGRGADLWLSPEYIRTSPVILRCLMQLKEGESRQFGFHQSEDWRLSYALNPFSLRKQNGKVLLWQFIKFETRPSTLTTMNYGIGKFQLPDALIYSMHPKAYTVYATWKL
jgi:hypothetical protein